MFSSHPVVRKNFGTICALRRQATKCYNKSCNSDGSINARVAYENGVPGHLYHILTKLGEISKDYTTAERKYVARLYNRVVSSIPYDKTGRSVIWN